MLFTKQELIMEGVIEDDYSGVIDEMKKGVEDNPDINPFDVFIDYHGSRAKRQIIKLITKSSYENIENKITGNQELEDDIKDAEIYLTLSFMIEARKRIQDDGFQSLSQEGISTTKENNNSSSSVLQRKAMVLIKRWFKC